MKEATVMSIATQALVTTFTIAAPILLVSLGVGIIVSLFQSITQIQDFTLTFVPKLAAIVVVFVVAGHFMLGTFIGFTEHLFQQLPSVLNTG